jgi:tetratricopeptide (TPR) repeat protein
LDDFSEAERLFRASLAASPAKEFEREATLELGMILQQVGRKGEAAALFQQLLDAPTAEKLGPDRLAWLAEFQLGEEAVRRGGAGRQRADRHPPRQGMDADGVDALGPRIPRQVRARSGGSRVHRSVATGASTAYGAEAALRLGELLTESGKYDEAAKHLDDAAMRASSSELLGLRAHAYAGLARNAELKGDTWARCATT